VFARKNFRAIGYHPSVGLANHRLQWTRNTATPLNRTVRVGGKYQRAIREGSAEAAVYAMDLMALTVWNKPNAAAPASRT
jgi:hypothetical protein